MSLAALGRAAGVAGTARWLSGSAFGQARQRGQERDVDVGGKS